MQPVLYIVVPCYNEQEVLPFSAPMLKDELCLLIHKKKVAENSRILFVDDGSKDKTWELILDFSQKDSHFCGISLSRNRGHQNALFAGLMEVRHKCDIAISIDCDGQDDITAMELMVDRYLEGCDIVYGVRSDRKSDSFPKRFFARLYYRLQKIMKIDSIYDHADFRLTSARVLEELSGFSEVNLYLRGMFPLMGFKSTTVPYRRTKRLAGKTHYPLKKMLSLAENGIVAFSQKPLKAITKLGLFMILISLAALLVFVISKVSGFVAWLFMALCFFSGIIVLCIGIAGEYIYRIYEEVKARPRYIVTERTEE